MNVQGLINLAHAKVEEIYDNSVWITFINDCLDDLTPIARLTKEATINNVPVVNRRATIPFTDPVLAKSHEILNIFFTPTQAGATPIVGASEQQMRRVELADRMATGWRLTSDTLYISNVPSYVGATVTAGNVTLIYYKALDHVTSLVSVPEIMPQYHPIIALYMCAKCQQKEEEINEKNDFYAEYLRGRNSMALDRIWDAEPQNRKFLRRSRIATHIGVSPGD